MLLSLGELAPPLLERPASVVVEQALDRFDEGRQSSHEKGIKDGEWCDWWLYDDLVYPFPKLSAAVGFEHLDVTPVTFDEIRPGSWIQSERLLDMDANHVDASICFPNVLPRFCGQTFLEREDKQLGPGVPRRLLGVPCAHGALGTSGVVSMSYGSS